MRLMVRFHIYIYIYMYVRSNIDKVFNSQLTSIEGFNTAVLAYIVSFSE